MSGIIIWTLKISLIISYIYCSFDVSKFKRVPWPAFVDKKLGKESVSIKKDVKSPIVECATVCAVRYEITKSK